MSGGLAALKKSKTVVPQSQLFNVYALIESHLCYADVIWDNLAKTKLYINDVYIKDTNSADENRTRNEKRDVFSTLRPFKIMLSSKCD